MKKMRITVLYDDDRYPLNIEPSNKVAELYSLLQMQLVHEIAQDKRMGKLLKLYFGGIERLSILKL